MKSTLLISAISLFLVGCNMKPSKEARLQELEKAVGQSQEHISELEATVKTLEAENQEMKALIHKIETTAVSVVEE